MKKILTIALAMSAVAGLWNSTEAQSKKMWDFALGVSNADRANLDADATNWNKNNVSEEGVTQYWNDLTKLSGTITANGEPLEYLQDLTVSTAGLSKSNNFKLGPTAFRMTRNNMELHLPKLANGQTITVLARSANGTATNRGIKGNGNMTYKSGPEGGICLGNQVEGSEGTYTYVWEVSTSEADSVDVALIMITGGVDIQSIMIDNGDEGGSEIDELNIAFLYDSSYNGAKDADKNPVGWAANGGLDNDPIYAALGSYNVTAIDYNGQALTSAELNDSLQKFDVVVAGECVSSGNALAKGLVDIVNKVPMLNLKSFMYKKGVWGWGAGVNPSPKNQCVTIPEDYLEDPLFADLEILFTDNGCNDGILPLFDCDDVDALNGNLVQAYSVNEDALIANDEVLAKVGDNLAIHRHGDKNQYMLIPLSSDNLDKAHGNVYVLIDNAVKILAATKSKVLNAATPTIAQQAADNATTVSITCSTPGSTIYYTTDGTEPTEQSTVYAEPFVVTQDSLVVKALATAHGYNTSKTASAIILVKSQAAAPAITVENLEGQAIITLTPAEGTIAYFSFNGLTDVTTTEAYTEPIVIREPATITAFASSTKALPSEVVSQEIVVGGIPAVKDTVAHFTANEEAWFTNAVIKNFALEDQALPESNWAAKAAYYWGKSAWAYYGEEVDHTEPAVDADGNPIKDVNGNDSITTIYKPNPEAAKYVYSTTDAQWRMRSQGQVLTGETNVSVSIAVGNGNTGYFAENATDMIGGVPSKGKVTFGGKGNGDPYSAAIESTVKFQPPFDIVTYLTNGGTGEPGLFLQTSVDGENWQDVAQLTNAKTQRYFKKDRNHVEGTEELYVRVAQVNGSSKAQLYDIYIITTEGSTGIEQIRDEQKADRRCYDLYGRELQAPAQGQFFILNGKKAILR